MKKCQQLFAIKFSFEGCSHREEEGVEGWEPAEASALSPVLTDLLLGWEIKVKLCCSWSLLAASQVPDHSLQRQQEKLPLRAGMSRDTAGGSSRLGYPV